MATPQETARELLSAVKITHLPRSFLPDGWSEALLDDYGFTSQKIEFLKRAVESLASQGILVGDGSPEGTVESNLSRLYVNETTNQIFINPCVGVNTGWVTIKADAINEDGTDGQTELIQSGSSEPNNVVTSNDSLLYVQTGTTPTLWFNPTEDVNTGWIAISDTSQDEPLTGSVAPTSGTGVASNRTRLYLQKQLDDLDHYQLWWNEDSSSNTDWIPIGRSHSILSRIINTGNQTLTESDNNFLIDVSYAGENNRTLNIDQSSNLSDGWNVYIRNTDPNRRVLQINAGSGDNLDGQSNISLPPFRDIFIIHETGNDFTVFGQAEIENATPTLSGQGLPENSVSTTGIPNFYRQDVQGTNWNRLFYNPNRNSSTGWEEMGQPYYYHVRAIRSSTVLSASDNKSFLRVGDTSGTINVTMPPQNQIENGWSTILSNSSDNNVMLDTPSTEQLNGSPTLTIDPDEIVVIYADADNSFKVTGFSDGMGQNILSVLYNTSNANLIGPNNNGNNIFYTDPSPNGIMQLPTSPVDGFLLRALNVTKNPVTVLGNSVSTEAAQTFTLSGSESPDPNNSRFASLSLDGRFGERRLIVRLRFPDGDARRTTYNNPNRFIDSVITASVTGGNAVSTFTGRISRVFTDGTTLVTYEVTQFTHSLLPSNSRLDVTGTMTLSFSIDRYRQFATTITAHGEPSQPLEYDIILIGSGRSRLRLILDPSNVRTEIFLRRDLIIGKRIVIQQNGIPPSTIYSSISGLVDSITQVPTNRFAYDFALSNSTGFLSQLEGMECTLSIYTNEVTINNEFDFILHPNVSIDFRYNSSNDDYEIFRPDESRKVLYNKSGDTLLTRNPSSDLDIYFTADTGNSLIMPDEDLADRAIISVRNTVDRVITLTTNSVLSNTASFVNSTTSSLNEDPNTDNFVFRYFPQADMNLDIPANSLLLLVSLPTTFAGNYEVFKSNSLVNRRLSVRINTITSPDPAGQNPPYTFTGTIHSVLTLTDNTNVRQIEVRDLTLEGAGIPTTNVTFVGSGTISFGTKDLDIDINYDLHENGFVDFIYNESERAYSVNEPNAFLNIDDSLVVTSGGVNQILDNRVNGRDITINSGTNGRQIGFGISQTNVGFNCRVYNISSTNSLILDNPGTGTINGSSNGIFIRPNQQIDVAVVGKTGNSLDVRVSYLNRGTPSEIYLNTSYGSSSVTVPNGEFRSFNLPALGAALRRSLVGFDFGNYLPAGGPEFRANFAPASQVTPPRLFKFEANFNAFVASNPQFSFFTVERLNRSGTQTGFEQQLESIIFTGNNAIGSNVGDSLAFSIKGELSIANREYFRFGVVNSSGAPTTSTQVTIFNFTMKLEEVY